MSKPTLPAGVNDAFKALSEAQLDALKTLKYQRSRLKNDLVKSYERLILDYQSQHKEISKAVEEKAVEHATTTLTEQFSDFAAALDEVNATTQSYEALLKPETYEKDLTPLFEELALERGSAAADHEILKQNSKISDHEFNRRTDKISYHYLAQKRDLIRDAAKKKTANNPLWQFALPSVERAIDKYTKQPFEEGPDVYHMVDDLVAGTLNPGNLQRPTVDYRESYIRTIEEIGEVIESKLVDYGIDESYIEGIDLLSGLQDRFQKMPDENISISSHELDRITGNLFTKINANENPLDILDYACKEIYEHADFKQDYRFKVEFSRRLGQEPHSSRGDVSPFGVSGKVALAGLGLSALSSFAGRSAQADAVAESKESSKEDKQKARNKRNAKIAFATTAGIISTMVLVDGLLLKGTFTKMILNGMTGKSESRSR